jgi:hypothetical protein
MEMHEDVLGSELVSKSESSLDAHRKAMNSDIMDALGSLSHQMEVLFE